MNIELLKLALSISNFTNIHVYRLVKKARQYTATKPVLFVFSFMEARGSFSPFYSALKLIFPKLLQWKDYFYSYYHKVLNMHKLLILFNISNTNCIKVSNITLGKYTLHICNIINLTVCEKKNFWKAKYVWNFISINLMVMLGWAL